MQQKIKVIDAAGRAQSVFDVSDVVVVPAPETFDEFQEGQRAGSPSLCL